MDIISSYDEAVVENIARDVMSTYVYFILASDIKRVKIGRSTRHPRYRLKELQTSSPSKLIILSYFEASCPQVEIALHQTLSDCHVTGEWFEARQRVLNYAFLAKIGWGSVIEYLIGDPFEVWADSPVKYISYT